MKALYLTAAILFASPAMADCKFDSCKRPFYQVSQVAQELSEYPYNEAGSVNSAKGNFDGGNCIDFTMKAWELMEARGFTNLKKVTLTSGDKSHMVLLVDDIYVLSAGKGGVSIKAWDYLNNWDIVEGL